MKGEPEQNEESQGDTKASAGAGDSEPETGQQEQRFRSDYQWWLRRFFMRTNKIRTFKIKLIFARART